MKIVEAEEEKDEEETNSKREKAKKMNETDATRVEVGVASEDKKW